jgi:hemerythrin-like domain-containing protein
MEAIEMLMTEHQLILQVIEALEHYAEQVSAGADADPKDLARFVEFISAFADTCHHGKEEHILFAAMITRGFSAEQGPVAVMLMEHTQGRELVSTMRRYAQQTAPWTDADKEEIASAAASYAMLLRNHIYKEDNILYPTAERMLGEDEMKQMSERFEEFERTKTGAGEHERLHALAESLIGQYASNSQISPGNHHHH